MVKRVLILIGDALRVVALHDAPQLVGCLHGFFLYESKSDPDAAYILLQQYELLQSERFSILLEY